MDHHIYCALSECRKRVPKGKRNKIGSPNFLPYFKRFVGSMWPNYNEQDYVCSKCHIKILHLERVRKLRTPGVRSYTSSNELMLLGTPEESLQKTRGQSRALQTIHLQLNDEPPANSEDDHEMNDLEHQNEMLQQWAAPALSEECSEAASEESGSTSSHAPNSEAQSTDSHSCISIDSNENSQTINLMSCSRSNSKCFICPSNLTQSESRPRIPKTAIKEAWIQMHLYIPPTNRCCASHLYNGLLTTEAKELIRSSEKAIKLNTEAFLEWLYSMHETGTAAAHIFDFGGGGVPDEKFETLLGVTKTAFDELATYLYPEMRNTSERSVPNALGMFLMLMRTSCSQEHIAYCFQTEQRVVSDAIASVASLLDRKFVPKNLGIGHLTIEEVVFTHSRKSFQEALGLAEETPLIISDGGYVYIEKPSSIEDQKLTYSDQKKRNFHRFMVTILPSGHILDVQGPFPAAWNDARILPSVITEEFRNFLGPSPAIVIDRGFRNCEAELKNKGFIALSPEWLEKSETQFCTKDGNSSRLVTMCRWPVEATFGRLKKKFGYFMNTVHLRYGDKIPTFFRICCSILNRFYSVGFVETERHVEHAKLARIRSMTEANAFQMFLEENNLIRLTRSWKRTDGNTITDFPKLSLSDLENITLGTYQLKTAKRYIAAHLKENGYFEIRVAECQEGFLRAQLHSRFSSTKNHNVFVKYVAESQTVDGIEGYYCTCKAGARTVGCCSHIATILRWFAYDRYLEQPRQRAFHPVKYHSSVNAIDFQIDASGPVPSTSQFSNCEFNIPDILEGEDAIQNMITTPDHDPA